MPELGNVRKILQNKYGESNVLLCGSGSATFAILPDSADPDETVADLQNEGY